MINNRSVIAIIPARAGSKGLPNKNKLFLCGRPLIYWTIKKALLSKYIDTICVSTDDHDILRLSLASGVEAPFLRPAFLATDRATSFAVVKHCLDFYLPNTFDYTMLLEPTSPLRLDDDIDRIIESLDASRDRYDSITSLGEVSHHPSFMKILTGQRVHSFLTSTENITRRQDAAQVFFPFGVAYAAKTENLIAHSSFYTTRTMGYPIKRFQCYEVDDFYDFITIETIMTTALGDS